MIRFEKPIPMDGVTVDKIDFNKPEWSWGFGEHGAYIYHTEFGETTTYLMPECMITVITTVRDHALDGLRDKLISLDEQRAELLKMTGEEFQDVT